MKIVRRRCAWIVLLAIACIVQVQSGKAQATSHVSDRELHNR
jgi:hypothetical protein